MSEGEFKNIVIGLIIFSLAVFLIILTVNSVSNNYSADTTNVLGSALDLDKFNDTILDINSTADTYYRIFTQGSIWDIAGVVVTGIFGIGIKIIELIFTPLTLMINILNDVLGIPTFVTAVIVAVFIIIIMFALWRLIKVGD